MVLGASLGREYRGGMGGWVLCEGGSQAGLVRLREGLLLKMVRALPEVREAVGPFWKLEAGGRFG